MNNKKKIVSTLRKADPADVERVISEAAAQEDVYARLRQRIAENGDEHIAEYGVEQYRRISITRIASIAASAVLIAGAALGAVHLARNAEPPQNQPHTGTSDAATETTAEAATEETTVPYTTEADVVPDEITPEFIYEQCLNAKKHYTKLSADYSYYNNVYNFHISADKKEIKLVIDREKGIQYDVCKEYTEPDDVCYGEEFEYAYGKKVINASNNSFAETARSYVLSDFTENFDIAGARSRLYLDMMNYRDELMDIEKSPWEITGEYEENGRRIVSVSFSYTTKSDMEESHYIQKYDIDAATGLIMGSELYDENYEGQENYLVSSFKVTDQKLDDEAEEPPAPKEIKDTIINGNYVNSNIETNDYDDLSYLDE